MHKTTNYIKTHPATSAAVVASTLAVGYALCIAGAVAFFLFALPVDDED